MSLAVLFGDILCLGLWGTCFLKLSKTNMVKDSLQSQKFWADQYSGTWLESDTLQLRWSNREGPN